jgi:superfamily II DNA or RNA helicase
MSVKAISTTRSQTRWTSQHQFVTSYACWPSITAEALCIVREPLRLKMERPVLADVDVLLPILRRAAQGPSLDDWHPPQWLYPHQIGAARRLAGALAIFRGALLADAVGLGKTYVSLALATRYRRTIAVVPAALVAQWSQTARSCGIQLPVISHEAMSRGRRIARTGLVIVDEAHRFRNPLTRRYDRLARDVRNSHLLLVSATPVVNSPKDLISLLRLFLPDHGLAMLGLDSLERAIADDDHASIVRAAAPLIVARSQRSVSLPDLLPLPTVLDAPVDRAPTVVPPLLKRLTRAIDRLEFPGFSPSPAVHLLRAHLYHRLGSSPAALRQTLRRHVAYLDRAESAARGGVNLSRQVSRAVFGLGDDLQLELSMLPPGLPVTAPPDVLGRERERVLRLLRALPTGQHESPKLRKLEQVLADRDDRKTIVFVSAVSTALDLARRLKWREIAVVAGGRAWIASGRIPIDVALGLFAPRARCAAEPSQEARVTTLIATDLVSEGLDLQDANGIVHFDLPWSPLRLAQRVGRVVRLGSHHTTAHVHWFAPPSLIESRLRSELRLARKAASQLRLGVPTTSTVGHAQVMSELWGAHEDMSATGGAARLPHQPLIGFTKGEPGILAAVTWWHRAEAIDELIGLSGTPLTPVSDTRGLRSLMDSLKSAAVADPLQQLNLKPLFDLVRVRLRAAELLPCDQATVALRRRILQLAFRAGARRQSRLVSVLDLVLTSVNAGLSEGAARELRDRLGARSPLHTLVRWLDRWPPYPAATPRCAIRAVIVSSGAEC